MSDAVRPDADTGTAWEEHVFQAAKAFLKCAVVIDDRPFGGVGALGQNVSRSAETVFGEATVGPRVVSPLPGTSRVAKLAKTATRRSGTNGGRGLDTREPESESATDLKTHDLDLRALTDSFANYGIICGTLIPDNIVVTDGTVVRGDKTLVDRACNMARTADILIIDWFLKDRNCETALAIIEKVLGTDKDDGGRTRLICIYTGEDHLSEIRDQVRERMSGHALEPNRSEDAIRLTNKQTSIAFVNKKRVDGQYCVGEGDLPKRLIEEFALCIDGLLPSFAASAIGALRRNTHGVLNIFRAGLDSAYVGNRTISDPSDEVAELVRGLLVSELDNQIGFAKSTDKYLSTKAIGLWLQEPGRIRRGCSVTLTTATAERQRVEHEIDVDLIRRAACGDIVSFDQFEMDGGKYTINEKQRRRFTRALCESDSSAKELEEEFARLTSNKHEAYGRKATEKGWRPKLTLGTILVTGDVSGTGYYMCITAVCDMLRLSGGTKGVVLVRLEQSDTKFNLVVPDRRGTMTRLYVPRRFGDMRRVDFKVDKGARRITGTERSGSRGEGIRIRGEIGGC